MFQATELPAATADQNPSLAGTAANTRVVAALRLPSGRQTGRGERACRFFDHDS